MASGPLPSRLIVWATRPGLETDAGPLGRPPRPDEDVRRHQPGSHAPATATAAPGAAVNCCCARPPSEYDPDREVTLVSATSPAAMPHNNDGTGDRQTMAQATGKAAVKANGATPIMPRYRLQGRSRAQMYALKTSPHVTGRSPRSA